MPFFPDEPVDLQVVGTSDWKVLRAFHYQGRDERFTIPAGMQTDLASVPTFLTWLVPRYGRYTKAAILHDHLWHSRVVPRADADGIFRRALREEGVPILQRWAMWAAVRLASSLRRQPGEARSGLGTDLALAAILVIAVVLLFAAGVTVLATLALVWVLEWLATGVEAIAHRVHPTPNQQLNRPRFLDPLRHH